MREKRTASQVLNIRRLRLWHTRDSHGARSSLLLLWAQRCSPLFSPLGRNVTREVASYLSLCRLLPGIYEGHLFVVNVYSETFRLVTSAANDWSNILLADDYTAICFSRGRDAYLVGWLDMLTLGFRELPALQTSQNYGISACYLSQTIYVLWRCSSVFHKFTVRDKQWSPLIHTKIIGFANLLVPHINSICIFSYILKTFQIFNTLTNQLGNHIALQTGLHLKESSPWVKSADGKLLLLGRGNALWTWDWEANTATKASKVTGSAQPATQGVTLLLGREMYWLGENSRQIHRFNIETLEKQSARLLQE